MKNPTAPMTPTIPTIGPYGRWGPARLFSGGAQGIFIDPSDLTTMFQDRAGTTPVTAPGQSVGLMLDKSQGLGPELVTNGGFDSNINGWIVSSQFPSSTAVEWSNGALHVYNTQTNYGESRSAAIPLTIGKRYVLEMEILAGTTDRYWIIIGSSASNDYDGRIVVTSESSGTSPSGYKRWRYSFVASYATAYLYFATNKVSGSHLYADNISVRELPGNHMTANNDAARGSYNVDEAGRGFILFDGVDDGYVTSTITPGTDKAQVFAGVRKLSDAATAILVELSESVNSNAGSLYVAAPEDLALPYSTLSRGTTAANANQRADTSSGAAPDTCVLTATHEIATDESILRRNGVQVGIASGDKGTGNFGAYPLFIGSRAGTSIIPFNGRLYSLIVRFGPNLTADQIAAAETWVNSKTGAY